MILVDTSIWIDHFRHVDQELKRILDQDRLLMHPAVIGELALGSLRYRKNVLALLAAQRQAKFIAHDDVMAMIERFALFNMGIGYTDAQLMASILLDGTAWLWTRDRRLMAAAEKAGISSHAPHSS